MKLFFERHKFSQEIQRKIDFLMKNQDPQNPGVLSIALGAEENCEFNPGFLNFKSFNSLLHVCINRDDFTKSAKSTGNDDRKLILTQDVTKLTYHELVTLFGYLKEKNIKIFIIDAIGTNVVCLNFIAALVGAGYETKKDLIYYHAIPWPHLLTDEFLSYLALIYHNTKMPCFKSLEVDEIKSTPILRKFENGKQGSIKPHLLEIETDEISFNELLQYYYCFGFGAGIEKMAQRTVPFFSSVKQPDAASSNSPTIQKKPGD